MLSRYAGIITATKAIQSSTGAVVEVLAEFKPLTEGAKPPKVSQWHCWASHAAAQALQKL